MPYTAKDCPPDIKKLPKADRDAWIGAFNGAYDFATKKKRKDPEAYAFAVANASLHKRGYAKKNGKWMKNEYRMPSMMNEDLGMDSTEGEIGAAQPLALLGFHGRLHRMYRTDRKDKDEIERLHGVVVRMLPNRGLKHTDRDELDNRGVDIFAKMN